MVISNVRTRTQNVLDGTTMYTYSLLDFIHKTTDLNMLYGLLQNPQVT